MKILWFSHFVPFPPRGGNAQRSFNLIRQASKEFEVDLVAFNQQSYSIDRIEQYVVELRRYCSNVEIWQMPVPWRKAKWWLSLAWSPLRKMPHTCRVYWSPQLSARWKRSLQDHQGDLVHFDSSDLALYVPAAKGFRKVLNHHNCESWMTYRRADVETNPLKKYFLRIQAYKLAKLEEDICRRFDVNLAVSELDANLIQERSPGAHVHVVENGTDTHYFSPRGSEEDPWTVVFAGSLDWYPNISGLRFFIERVWPLLKCERPQVRLYLAGKNPSKFILQTAIGDPSITVIADPADIRPWIARAAVFVCPIYDGGGTRLKILDAMAMGKAIVSTSVGCEGLRVNHGDDILIADTPREMAREIGNAMDDQDKRLKMGARARERVQHLYSWEVIGKELSRAQRCALTKHCDLSAGSSEPAQT